MFGMSMPQLLIILLLVVLLFGSKRLGSLGQDFGKMIKGFKNTMSEEDEVKTDDAKKIKADEATSAAQTKRETSDTETK